MYSIIYIIVCVLHTRHAPIPDLARRISNLKNNKLFLGKNYFYFYFLVKSQETGVQEKLLKIGKTNPGNVENKYATRYTL